MGLPYVPLYVVFPRGKEAIALRVALQKPKAWAYVAEMWCGVAQNAADGRVEGPAAVQQLEEWAGWDGAPGSFVEALCLPHVGLLDVTERGFYVHNWDLHCGLHIQKREKDRDRKRASRVPKASKDRPRTVRGQKQDVRRNSREEGEGEREQIPTTTPAEPAPARTPDPADARWPLVAAVLLALWDRKVDALWPAEAETTDRLERALAAYDVTAAADLLAASLAADPGHPWLGWHIDALKPKRKARTHGDLGAELRPWPDKLTPEERRQARAEFVAIAGPDFEFAPLQATGDSSLHPVEQIREFHEKWRAKVEARP